MSINNQFTAASFRKLILTLCGVIVVSAVSNSNSPVLAESTLSGKQLRTELVGRWIRYQGVRTRGWYIYRNDGTVFVRTSSQARTGGTWSIRGNKFCSRMKFRNNRLFCFTVTQLGQGRYRTSHKVSLFVK